jgi:hypothetical protein
LQSDDLKGKAEARHCQIVFVSSSESVYLAELFVSLQKSNVLLVGEMNGFAVWGGSIEFAIEENHVRFAINIDAADRSGLKFSSKLVAVAKNRKTIQSWAGSDCPGKR